MYIIISLLSLLAGAGLGVLVINWLSSKKSQDKIREAQEQADKLLAKAEEKAREILSDVKDQQKELAETRIHLAKKETLLDERQNLLTKKEEDISKEKEEVEKQRSEIQEKVAELHKKLEEISGFTKDEAKDYLIKSLEKQYEEDLLRKINKLELQNKEELEKRAKDILVTSIQRLSVSTASEITTTTVSLPNDDIKGKIIGKEGRNIRAFEKATGTELIVDDSPGVVVISSYDPIRRQVAKVALENLMVDGRIQPAKIEEFVAKAKKEINKIIEEKGNWAVNELGVYTLDPKIVAIVGRLYFRTSYGQNVLLHSVEMAHLAGMIAEEVGANVDVVKAGCLVHDIGKALDHELQGSHIEIGIRLLEKFGTDTAIIDAMKSHHDDYPHASIEAVILQTADMISGSRPGARRDTLENYLKRLKELETVASSFSGVENVYALSAGREVRVFVKPEEVSDLEAKKLARDIAKKIESDLKYPGKIRVVLIRETRVTEYAV